MCYDVLGVEGGQATVHLPLGTEGCRGQRAQAAVLRTVSYTLPYMSAFENKVLQLYKLGFQQMVAPSSAAGLPQGETFFGGSGPAANLRCRIVVPHRGAVP